MPYNDYPHKTEPGYVTARKCSRPCGGWIVLYDRRKHGPKEMKLPEKKTGRWILMLRGSVEPNWTKWTGIEKKTDAMEYLCATAKGEDVCGILPATVKPRDDINALTNPAPIAPQVPQPPQAEQPEKTPEPSASAPPTSSRAREEQVPDALAIHRALTQQFGAVRFAQEIEEGLQAVKSYQTGEGQVVTVPDHATRVKYLDLLAKYRIGIPDKREKASEPKKITMDELEVMILRSPAARRRLAKMITDAEKQEKDMQQGGDADNGAK